LEGVRLRLAEALEAVEAVRPICVDAVLPKDGARAKVKPGGTAAPMYIS